LGRLFPFFLAYPPKFFNSRPKIAVNDTNIEIL
jgi:hypothetical protein